MDQEEFDLERVRLFWELKKDLNIGYLFGVLFPAILVIFVVAESYIQSNPPNISMAIDVSVIGLLALIAYGVVWLVRMKRIVRETVRLLTRVKQKKEIDSFLPKSFNPHNDAVT